MTQEEQYSKDYYPTAFQAGYDAAKNGSHIDNSYPYLRPSNEYWAWIDGYRSYKP